MADSGMAIKSERITRKETKNLNGLNQCMKEKSVVLNLPK